MEATRIEQIWQDFKDQEFVLVGMDVADGGHQVVDAVFRQHTGTTYPLLLRGSKVGTSYGFTQHNYAVIDHEGIVRYRSTGNVVHRFNEKAIREHIKAALDNLDTAFLTVEERTARAEGTEASESTADAQVAAPTENETPQDFHLERNFPNPFNAATTIRFSLTNAAHAELRVYDILGRLVSNLAVGQMSAGEHSVHWDGRDTNGRPVSSGTYFYRLSTGTRPISRKMLVLR